jgi:hypothetical protein
MAVPVDLTTLRDLMDSMTVMQREEMLENVNRTMFGFKIEKIKDRTPSSDKYTIPYYSGTGANRFKPFMEEERHITVKSGTATVDLEQEVEETFNPIDHTYDQQLDFNLWCIVLLYTPETRDYKSALILKRSKDAQTIDLLPEEDLNDIGDMTWADDRPAGIYRLQMEADGWYEKSGGYMEPPEQAPDYKVTSALLIQELPELI